MPSRQADPTRQSGGHRSLDQHRISILPRPRTSLVESHEHGTGSDALSRVSSFFHSGRASLGSDTLAMLRKNRSQSASLPVTQWDPVERARVPAWSLHGPAPVAAPRKSAAAQASRRLPAVRPQTSFGMANSHVHGVFAESLQDLPPRPNSVTGPLSRDSRKRIDGRMIGSMHPKEADLKELERYADYVEECTANLEDRLFMQVPRHESEVSSSRRASMNQNWDGRDEINESTLDFSNTQDSLMELTKNDEDFNEELFDQRLAAYLNQERWKADCTRAVLKLQNWWRMKFQRFKFLRFKAATRVFCNRAQILAIKGWHMAVCAESWMRGLIASKHLDGWRMLARNSAYWSEESAFIFVECMRAQSALQLALFLECNDKRIFRRAGIDYNWGQGWKFGRPLPPREHVMVVQVLRHTMMWSARMRMRRWHKYLQWRHHQRAEAYQKIQDVCNDRLNQMFRLDFIMWYRWGVTMRCERNLQDVPMFEPRVMEWETWYHKRQINRMQEEGHRQIGEGEVQSLKWRFLCRSMWVMWNAYLQARRDRSEVKEKLTSLILRKQLSKAFRGWLDVQYLHKALRHRYMKILHSLREFVQIRMKRRRAGAAITRKWQMRCIKRVFQSLSKLATFMLVVNAGGLNRIRRNSALGKWALSAWLAHGMPLEGQQRKPGGICSMGICDGHFHLFDSWKLWSSMACRRLRTKRLLLSCFYETNVYSGLLPAFILWRKMVKNEGGSDTISLRDILPTGGEKVRAYKEWLKTAKRNSLVSYCDSWAVFPRLVAFQVSHKEQKKQKETEQEALVTMSVRDRMHRRRKALEVEMGIDGKMNISQHFPVLRDFLQTEHRMYAINHAENVKALNRDYKLLLMCELNDVAQQYSSIYATEYAHLQGKKPIPFKSVITHTFGEDDEADMLPEHTWFPESTHNAGRERTSSAPLSAIGDINPLSRSNSLGKETVDEEFLLLESEDPVKEDSESSAHVGLVANETSVDEHIKSSGNEVNETEKVEGGEDSAPVRLAHTLQEQKQEDTEAVVVSMWDYEEDGQANRAQRTVEEQMTEQLDKALQEMYDKMVSQDENDQVMPRRERKPLPQDPYFDISYPERQKRLQETYSHIRERELGERSTHHLLEISSTRKSAPCDEAAKSVMFSDVLESSAVDKIDVVSPKNGSMVESDNSAASHGFYGIDVAMDLDASSVSERPSGIDASGKTAGSRARPRRKSAASSEVYKKAIQTYKTHAANTGLNSVKEQSSGIGVKSAAVVQNRLASDASQASDSMSSPLVSNTPASSSGRRPEDATETKVVTHIPTIQLASSTNRQDVVFQESIEGKTDAQQSVEENSRPRSSHDVGSDMQVHLKRQTYVSSQNAKIATLSPEIRPRPLNNDDEGISIPIRFERAPIRDGDGGGAGEGDSRQSSKNISRSSTIRTSSEDPWNTIITENGWLQQEAKEVAEAMRGGLDSLYWRSQVISKRSRRVRAVQMAIDKDFVFSQALQLARTQKMQEDLYVAEINSLAKPINGDDLHSGNKQKLLINSGGLSAANRSRTLGSLSNVSSSDTQDVIASPQSSSQILEIPNTEEREFIRLSSSMGVSKSLRAPENRIKTPLKANLDVETMPAKEFNLSLSPSPIDSIFISKVIPGPSSTGTDVPRFNEEFIPPRKARSNPQITTSAPTEIRDELSSSKVGVGTSKPFRTLDVFPRHESEHVTEDGQGLRDLEGSSRPRASMGKLVKPQIPYHSIGARPSTSMCVTGGHLEIRKDSHIAVGKKDAHVALKDGPLECPAIETGMGSFVHEFGQKPSADEQAEMKIGGVSVGNTQVRKSSANRSSKAQLGDLQVVTETSVGESKRPITGDVDMQTSDVSQQPEIRPESNTETELRPEEQNHTESKTSIPQAYEEPEPSGIHDEERRSTSRVDLLWQPWRRMDSQDILSELLDGNEEARITERDVKTLNAKEIFEMCDALGADGEIDFSQWPRKPFRNESAGISSPMSTITAYSSRPSSGMSRLPSANSSRPVSSHGRDSRPVSALQVSPQREEGRDGDLVSVGSSNEASEELLNVTVDIRQRLDSSSIGRQRLYSEPPSKETESENSAVKRKMLSKEKAARSTVTTAPGAGYKGTWGGVVKHDVQNDAKAFAGPYLSAKSVNISSKAVTTAVADPRKSIQKEGKSAGLQAKSNKATTLRSRRQSPQANATQVSESNQKEIAQACSQEDVQISENVEQTESYSDDVLQPAPTDELISDSVSSLQLVPAQESTQIQDMPSSEQSTAVEQADETILNSTRDKTVDAAEYHSSDVLKQSDNRDADGQPTAHEREDEQESSEIISDRKRALYVNPQALKELSDQDFQRTQELLEGLDVECSSSRITTMPTKTKSDDGHLEDFQDYVTMLDQEKLDAFEEGLNVNIKDDATHQFSPKAARSLKSPKSYKKKRHEQQMLGDAVEAQHTTKDVVEGTGNSVAEEMVENRSPREGDIQAFSDNVREQSEANSHNILHQQLPEGAEHANNLDDQMSKDGSEQTSLNDPGSEDGSDEDDRQGECQLPNDVDESNSSEGGLKLESKSSKEGSIPASLMQPETSSSRDVSSSRKADDSDLGDVGSSPQDSARKEQDFYPRPSKVRGRATKKPPVQEIDLFRKYREHQFIHSKKDGKRDVFAERRNLVGDLPHPGVRRVVLSSDSSGSDWSEGERDEHPKRRATGSSLAQTDAEDAPEGIGVGREPSVASSQEEKEEQEGRLQKERAWQEQIAGKRYDAFYGSQRYWNPFASESGAGSTQAGSHARDDEDEEELQTAHWSKDRRLKHSHYANRFYEALRLRHGIAKECDENEETVRERLLHGQTVTTTTGEYDSHLALVRKKKEAINRKLGLKAEYKEGIHTLPRRSAPRPGALTFDHVKDETDPDDTEQVLEDK
jgi:hypothetical protein